MSVALVSLVFPLPPAALSPNARVHHMAKARAVKAYKADCLNVIRAIVGPTPHPVREPHIMAKVGIAWKTATATNKRGKPVVVTIPDGCYRPRDLDNAIASLKPLLDAIVGSGLIADDNASVLKRLDVVIDPTTYGVHCSVMNGALM